MKISAINSTPHRTNFTGENSKKANGVKTAAGAAMIALATAVPTQEANAQYYVPYYPPVQYYVPTAPVMNIPNCFVYGDVTNEDYEKTMPDVFNEIDSAIKQNGQISVNEVVGLEEYNWNMTHTYPMTRAQKVNTANLVKNLSRRYNNNGSNPNTINYGEYKNIMEDYMQSKNIANFMNLLQIFANPYFYHPHPYHPPMHHHRPLPPPHHHHHR